MMRKNIYRVSVLLTVLVLLVTYTVSYALSQRTNFKAASSEVTEWTTYTDPRFDITLAYPANWELRPPTDRPDAIGSRIVLSESPLFLSETQVPRKIEIGLHLVEYSPSQSLANWSQLYDTYNGVLDSSRLLLLNDRETVHNNRTVFSREAISPLTPYTYFHIPHGRRGIIKSCGLANGTGWRILLGDKTYKRSEAARRIRHVQRYHTH